ncbi:MAG TPA: gliding motility-associated C-terminal domain-containing protein, partial [Saprospiraceae bacterium]|nr:gliding motility-associated C-terminal domain-containing protein [Saprospiraceae bacterium]
MIQSRLLLFLFALLFFGRSLYGQNYFQNTYNRNIRDEGWGLDVLPNNDIVIAGATGMPFIGSMWIQRLNNQGAVLWAKAYKAGVSDVAVDIRRVQSGGGFWVVFNGVDHAGWMKISETGDALMSRATNMLYRFKRIAPVSDGGYLITGYEEALGFNDAFLLKINTNGDIVWKTKFGSSADDAVEKCWEDAEGFIYCCGFTTQQNGNRDGMLAKLSPTGAVLWTRSYGSAGVDQFTGIAPFGSDSSLLLAGYSAGFGSDYEVWLTKVNSSGTLKWSRTYSIQSQDLGAIDLLQNPGNQFIVATGDPFYQDGSPAILFKISEDGNLLWEYEYKTGGESALLREVAPAPDGFVAIGSTRLNGGEDIYLLKVAADGLIPGSDCCPVAAGLTVRDVLPEQEPFTAGSNNTFAANAGLWSVSELIPDVTNICSPIDLTFSVSDSSICPGECVDITITGNTPGVTYSFTSNGGVFDPDNPLRVCFPNEGDYFITRKGENSVCSKDLSIKIEVGNRPDAFPNAFTPNGDGVNDTFKPVFFCPVATTNFKIYNRWGQKVFETRDPNAAWDGRVDGTEAASDVYAWQVEYEVVRDG